MNTDSSPAPARFFSRVGKLLAVAGLGCGVLGCGTGRSGAAFAATLRVPADQPTIQAAIDAAKEGDVVMLAPGIYRESLKLTGKSLTIASEFLLSNDPRHVASTVARDAVAGRAPDLGATETR